MWDIVLHENNLDEASEHLCGWLEEYWAATHPPMRSSATTAALAAALPGLPGRPSMMSSGLDPRSMMGGGGGM